MKLLTPALFTPLTLPNGAVIANRLAKAAMEENMADADHAPSDALVRLYEAWANGNVGLMLTGNVMVDHRAERACMFGCICGHDAVTTFL